MHKINKGFTLVEMAVVLVIIGLTLGAILGVASTQVQAARISSTKQKQEAIKVALSNFIARYNRLPCPAIATLTNSPVVDVGYGVEAATPGTCTGTQLNGTVTTGIVPWVTLGLSDEVAADGYYNRYTYQVALAATNTSLQTVSGMRGAISTHFNAPITMGAPAVGNQSNDCTPAGGVYNPCAAVVVVLSHGANGNGAYSRQGIQTPLPTGADELENANADNHFVTKDFSTDLVNPFDDVVMVLSATDLLAPLAANGSVQDYSSAINDDFANIKSAVIASSVANRAGTPGTYDYPVSAVLPLLPVETSNDPWGNPYLYINNPLVPSVNTATAADLRAFTISSNGPDGVVGTDDISTIVNVNQLQDAFGKVGW